MAALNCAAAASWPLDTIISVPVVVAARVCAVCLESRMPAGRSAFPGLATDALTAGRDAEMGFTAETMLGLDALCMGLRANAIAKTTASARAPAIAGALAVHAERRGSDSCAMRRRKWVVNC